MTLIKHARLGRSARTAEVLGFFVALVFMLGPEYASGQILVGCPPERTPPSGMVAWWRLGETQGATTVFDSAGGTNNGTPMPLPVGQSSPIGFGPSPVSGFVGNALHFYKGNFVRIDNSANPNPGLNSLHFGAPPNPASNKSFSIDAWVKGNTGTSGPIVSNYSPSTKFGYSLTFANATLATTNRLRFEMGRGSLVPTISNIGPPINTNVWQFVAVVVDRSARTVTLFTGPDPVNGTLNASASPIPKNAFAFSGLPLTIGRCGGSFAGCITIDEVEIFNRVLSGPEVDKIFKMGNKGKCVTNIPT